MTKFLLGLSLASLLLALPAIATETKPKKEPTPAQLQARERQKQCGAEWQQAKAAKTLPADATWPKYWSACNTRLKTKSA